MARKYKKRKHKRKRNKTNSLVLRGPTIVPDQMFTKLTYRGNYLLKEPNGLPVSAVYRGNSIFDPEFGPIAGQPLGRDQWANFYGQYQVMASKIVAKVLPTASQGQNFSIVVVPTTDPSFTGIQQLQEQPYAKSRLLSSKQENAKTISSYMKSGAIFGSKSIVQEEDTQAIQTANPSKEWYWLVASANQGLSGTGQMEVDVMVEIEYYVRFFDRKQLNRS